MVKHFNIIMAGVISGIVALFTSFLGISGTVIGSVLSSFLYQLLSTYYDEKTKDIDFSKVGNRKNNPRSSSKVSSDNRESNKKRINSELTHKIAFIFPIVVILIIESLFCLTGISFTVSKLFYLLEAATDQNLFRVMGISLVIISIYPFVKPKIIKRINGFILLILGILVFLRGIMDIHPILIKIYYLGFDSIDLLLGVIICIVLLIIIINVLIPSKSSINISKNKEWNAKKINTHFDNSHNYAENNAYIDNNLDNYSIKNRYVDDFNTIPNNIPKDNFILDKDSSFIRNDGIDNNMNNKIYVDDYGEPIPIYEEDYIYVSDPNNPNRTIKKKILKKISEDVNRPKRK